MESKKMYIYQLSLADGMIIRHASQGLMIEVPCKESEKEFGTVSSVLINSAVLIDSYMADEHGKRIEESAAHEDSQSQSNQEEHSPEQNQVVDLDTQSE